MAPKHPAQTTRGNLSARQWQDLRQAARLARSEGVSVTWRRDGSILISPLKPPNDSTNTAGSRQSGQVKKQETTRDADVPKPMETDGNKRATASKKQQRDTRRLQEYQESKRVPQSAARWLLLTQRQLWAARKASCNAVSAGWMRSQTPEARPATRRKLRDLLWRAWTHPQIEPPQSSSVPRGCTVILTRLQVLGMRSFRDEYIRARQSSLQSLASRSRALQGSMVMAGLPAGDDFDRTHKAARSPETAGLGTSISARSRKKSRGGKKS
eukprot:CAMPEP_0183341034 /NCGR_PEP_ID=MMETSP0164_2-20130417/7383_1 /TAXON_ID=221442 /ORGANISM="Coccolithus pelagicus ssp braarudi, Strain PLY182g" /LENGTH=268 /DNA_ID=CAMNT_0025511265 /DNA_START=206 /DNA_END=1013 /DNA_ORIENTATION=+